MKHNMVDYIMRHSLSIADRNLEIALKHNIQIEVRNFKSIIVTSLLMAGNLSNSFATKRNVSQCLSSMSMKPMYDQFVKSFALQMLHAYSCASLSKFTLIFLQPYIGLAQLLAIGIVQLCTILLYTQLLVLKIVSNYYIKFAGMSRFCQLLLHIKVTKYI